MRSRVWVVVAAMVWSSANHVAAAEPKAALPPMPLSPDGQRYFPESLRHQILNCPRFRADVPPMTVMDEWREGITSEFLAAAREPSLAKYAQDIAKSRGSAVRLTWLRSFDEPVTVRLEWAASGRMHLTARMLSGKGGYGPGKIKQRMDRDLSPAEAEGMNRLFARVGLWSQPSAICDAGLDGAEWLFEGADTIGYHLVRRQSPEKGPVREAGLAMLKLTGWSFKDIY